MAIKPKKPETIKDEAPTEDLTAVPAAVEIFLPESLGPKVTVWINGEEHSFRTGQTVGVAPNVYLAIKDGYNL